MSFGPALPPHMLKPSDAEEASVPSLEPLQESPPTVGPRLPPHLLKRGEEENERSTIGPSLPPHLRRSLSEETKEEPELSPTTFGPSLPPHLLKKSSEEPDTSTVIGPTIPAHLRKKLEEESIDDEDDVYGPVPVGSELSSAQLALEERALQMRIDKLGPKDDKGPVREEWMVELPDAKRASFGLGPRSFRAKAGPDLSDRSSWTDTPNSKKKKVEEKLDIKEEARIKDVKKRDKHQEHLVKKSKRASESLVEMHTKKLKKDKKEQSGPSERKPFSRETDLQVNRFDEAQKKAVLKKAQLLDTRFSAGESKFL